MAGMEGLGRDFNVVPAANGVWINLRYASGLTFVCTGANAETFTVTQAKDNAGTGAKNLASVKHVFTNASAAGANAWAEAGSPTPDTPTAVVTTTTAAPVAAFFINPSSLDDGFKYVKVTRSASGTAVAITHDLVTARKPSNLPPLGV